MVAKPVSVFALVVRGPGMTGPVGKRFDGLIGDHWLGGCHVGVVLGILDTCVPVW